MCKSDTVATVQQEVCSCRYDIIISSLLSVQVFPFLVSRHADFSFKAQYNRYGHPCGLFSPVAMATSTTKFLYNYHGYNMLPIVGVLQQNCGTTNIGKEILLAA